MKRKKPPLEQIAYDAFTEYCVKGTPESDLAFRRAMNEWQAVKEGRAEPLPEYR